MLSHIRAILSLYAAQAGPGHQRLIWNEGRWCFRMDSPTDPALRNKKYPGRDQLAKNIVIYLDKNMLPAPQKIGVVHIGIWDPNDYSGGGNEIEIKKQSAFRVRSVKESGTGSSFRSRL